MSAPKLVHRLDRDTSGLLVVAKSAAAARELAFAFQQHRMRKLYWAVLLKGPERNQGLIDVPLGKAGPPGHEKMRVPDEDDEGEAPAKNARTRFMILARAGKVAAWTALMPLTGRTHQLRAHTAAIGSPILGDGKYGGAAATRPVHPRAWRCTPASSTCRCPARAACAWWPSRRPRSRKRCSGWACNSRSCRAPASTTGRTERGSCACAVRRLV